jgi:gluconokinase
MQEPYILGIDIGTGSTKAVAVNFGGSAILTTQAYYPTDHPHAGYSEQDPELIWQAFISCVKEVIQKQGTSPAAISFSSAMHSVIAVNADGQPLAPMITWADARSANIAERIRESAAGERIYRTTGTPVFAMSPLTKIIWLREEVPHLFKRSYKFISIKEFIWFRIFNDYQVDHSIACGTGLIDLTTLSWSEEALQLAGINVGHLSSPVSTGYTRNDFQPTSTWLPELKQGTPFVIGGSDGCLANLGSLAIEEQIAAITIGTSGAVRISSRSPIFNYAAMTFNYRLDEETFICGGPVNNGGIALQWLIKNFFGKKEITAEEYDQLFRKIKPIAAGSEGLLFLPYLAGERAPVWDTKSSGAFLGLRLHHTDAHFAKAVLEGVCFGLCEVLQAVEEGSGKIKRIHVSGGFITSQLWIRMLADITGKQIAVVHAEDASATGAAMLAMKSLGIIKDYSFFLKEKHFSIIEPDESNHKTYRQVFSVYKSLYPHLKEAMHRLNQVNN